MVRIIFNSFSVNKLDEEESRKLIKNDEFV